ncbi:MAG: sodium:solute symporter family protein [Calditrichaeota bacterium]|nr:sodium:solute symporter family protein [Calditrichota bacterium]
MNTDLFLFIAYISVLLFLGWKARQKSPSQEEYLLSSRSLSLPSLVATLVTTWYGGILGVGEFIYTTGVSAWVIFGIPYYFFAILFALFIAPKIRQAKYISIPDLLYKNFGNLAGLLGSLFILFITSPAPYILITGVLISYMLNIPLLFSVIGATLFSIIYLFKGGFNSVVQTDKFQFILMFGGFILLFVFLVNQFGNPINQFSQLSQNHQSLSGGLSFQNMLVWFFIASWTFIDPGFHQRTAAAKNPATAKKAILVSILFWFVFDMLTLWTGIYATNILTNADPIMIYPLIAEQVLPPVLKGIFILALLATAMSTVDSFSFLSAQTFGRDIIAFWNKKDSDKEVEHYTQLGLLLTAIIALLLIWLFPSVVSLWYNLGSLFIPPLLIPVLSAVNPKFRLAGRHVVIIMLSGFLTSAAWFIFGAFNGFDYPMELEPFIPGLVVSILLFVGFKINDKLKGLTHNQEQ